MGIGGADLMRLLFRRGPKPSTVEVDALARRDSRIRQLEHDLAVKDRDYRSAILAKKGHQADVRRLSHELDSLTRLARAALVDVCLACEPNHALSPCGCGCHAGHGRARVQLEERLAVRGRRREGAA